MSADREADFKTVMESDATLMSILTGGVYIHTPEGVSRATTPGAYDANGFLKPCALVIAEREIYEPALSSLDDDGKYRVTRREDVAVYIFQDRGVDKIDQAIQRIKALFIGRQFNDSLPIEWAGTLPRNLDTVAATKWVNVARVAFRVRGVMSDYMAV